MPLTLRTALLAGLACTPLPAQGADEARMLADGAERLSDHATVWSKAGFHTRAARLWREVVTEYDRNHEASWNALGHTRLGSTWAPDETKPYPTEDTGKPSRRRGLESKWKRVARTMADKHRKMAEVLGEAGDDVRARYHLRRVLRYAPGDDKAGTALGYGAFDGVFGSTYELTVLARSRLLRQTVEYLHRCKFPVRRLPESAVHPLIDQELFPVRGVRSAHFEVWGDIRESHLIEAAQTAERCLLLCRTAFGATLEFGTEPNNTAEIAFFTEAKTWRAVLAANRDLFDPGYLDFLVKNCSAAYLNAGDRILYAVTEKELDRVLDHTARAVAIDLAHLSSPALSEGIGHAVVGMLLGKNLVYVVHKENEEERTSARGSGSSNNGKVLHPDMVSWQRMARDAVWRPGSTRAAQLPLIPADNFKLEERAAAWALCDYLLRRDPALLRQLDDAAVGAPHAGAVETAFDADAQRLALRDLEEQWRAFWRDDARLLPAATEPAARSVSSPDRHPTKWVDAVNDVRTRLGLEPVAWVRADGDANGAALVARTRDPAVAVRRWLASPGQRHILLDAGLQIVTFAAHKGRTVLGVQRHDPRDQRSEFHPFDDQTGVPPSVAAADVPGLTALLAARDKGELTSIGFPMSLHLRGATPEEVTDVQCIVECGGDERPGFLLPLGTDGDPAVSGPAVAAFYPFEPLPVDAQVHVTWTWRLGESGPKTTRHVFFRTGQ